MALVFALLVTVLLEVRRVVAALPHVQLVRIVRILEIDVWVAVVLMFPMIHAKVFQIWPLVAQAIRRQRHIVLVRDINKNCGDKIKVVKFCYP